MVAYKEYGGEDATRFIIKNFVSALGVGDVESGQKLFEWSPQWGDIGVSGSNTNKWCFLWNGAEGDHTKRHPEHEAMIVQQTKRVNKMLPTKVVIKYKTKQHQKNIRRLRAITASENTCMVFHGLQFVHSGKSGRLSRDPRKV